MHGYGTYEDADMEDADFEEPISRHVDPAPQHIAVCMHVASGGSAEAFLVLDTNVLMHRTSLVQQLKDTAGPGRHALAMQSVQLTVRAVIAAAVPHELEALKYSLRHDAAKLAAVSGAVRLLQQQEGDGFFVRQHDEDARQAESIPVAPGEQLTNDDRILQCCLQLRHARQLYQVSRSNYAEAVVLLSNDDLLRLRARNLGIPALHTARISPRLLDDLYQQCFHPAEQLQPVQLSLQPQTQLKQAHPNAPQTLEHQQQRSPVSAKRAGLSGQQQPETDDWHEAATIALRLVLDSLQPAMLAVLQQSLGPGLFEGAVTPPPPWQAARHMLDALRTVKLNLGLRHADASDFDSACKRLAGLAVRLDRRAELHQDAAAVRDALTAALQLLKAGAKSLMGDFSPTAPTDQRGPSSTADMQQHLTEAQQHIRGLLKQVPRPKD